METTSMMLWITLPTEDYKKTLKIPNRQLESVYRRRTDNAMAKRKSTKWWFPELAPLGSTSPDPPIMSISGNCMSLLFPPELSALWSE
jgi:hypothetical protein